MRSSHIIKALEQEKQNTRKIVITSVLIGLSINIIASGLSSLPEIKNHSTFQVLFGSILAIIVLIAYSFSNYSKLNKRVDFSSIVFYNQATNAIIPVDCYEFSEDLDRFLSAAFVEKKALKTIWDNAPLNQDFSFSDTDEEETSPRIPDKSKALVHELIEYCVLEQLSTHLCDYFNSKELNNIAELSVIDIPDILLNNRFLKLFTEDMSNRDLFDGSPCCSIIQRREDCTSVVRALHPSGAIYSRFDLVLPHNTKVSRADNSILISTSYFDLSIYIDFNGYSTTLPRYFSEYYIGVKDDDIIPFLAEISIHFRFKKRSFLSSNRSAYYLWADQFLDVLDNYLSEDQFFKSIGWSLTQTNIICLLNRKKNLDS